MNLLGQFDKLVNAKEESIATITGQRSGGQVVARTLGGSVVILTGEMATGDKCFYDRTTGRILRQAPNIEFHEYGV